MTVELFLVFGISYFLISILASQPLDERAKRVGNVIIGVAALVAGIMVAFPGIG